MRLGFMEKILCGAVAVLATAIFIEWAFKALMLALT